MIWIIASIPFWVLAAFFLFAVIAAALASFADGITQAKFNQCMGAIVLFGAGSGIMALIAAKICS